MRFYLQRSMFLGLAALCLSCAWPQAESRAGFEVTNLVSDIAGLAAHTDTNFRNPWGVSSAPTGPFWVSDQASNKATLYNGSGNPLSLVVSIPTTGAGPQGPTGQVFNGNSNDFLLSNGRSSVFLFANLNGQIAGWNGGTSAQTVVSGTNAIYTGLATAQVGTNNMLYAADALGNKIDVYNSSFTNLNSTSFLGKFADPTLTNAGFSVFNVQTIGGSIYVTYGNSSNGADAAKNGGAIAIFDLQGNLIRDFSNGAGGPLEDPWGVTIAPRSFGPYGGDLLIGNQEQGQINAYDPTTGSYLGNITTIRGTDATSTNNGLWALTFGNGGAGGDPNTLYAFAGINNETDGLLVGIASVPEPSSAALVGIGGAIVLAIARRRRASNRV